MQMSYVFAVVITGLVVVFLGLILLIAFISLIGKIFSVIEKKRAEKSADKGNEAPAVQKPVPAVSAVPAASASDDEIIAVISAAVAMMSAADNTTYRVKSVKAVSSNAAAGNAWAAAGLREYTNPF